MKLIVLTGGISCGKTTCSRYISQQYGIPVVDSDEIVHSVQQRGEPGYNRIVAEFGSAVLASDGSIDRRALGSIVFADAVRRRRLNAIIHPLVYRALLLQTLRHWLRREPIVVLDIPLFFEGRIPAFFFDEIVNVYSNPTIQLRRLMKRNSLTEEEAMSRIGAQMPGEIKCRRATIVLKNDGTEEEFKEQIGRMVDRLRERRLRIPRYPDPLFLLLLLVLLVVFLMVHRK